MVAQTLFDGNVARHAQLVENALRIGASPCRYQFGYSLPGCPFGRERNSQLMNASIVRSNLESSLDIHRRFVAACLPDLIRAADALVSAYEQGHKALFFGNGGSAA